MLLNYKYQHIGNNGRRKGRRDLHFDGDEEAGEQIEMSFLQAGIGIPGSDGVLYNQIKCFSCNKMEHYVHEQSPELKTVCKCFRFTLVTRWKKIPSAISSSYIRTQNTARSYLYGFYWVALPMSQFLKQRNT